MLRFRSPGHQAIKDQQNVAGRISVVHVPHRNGLHAQGPLEFVQRLGAAHAKPLLQHLRAVKAGHPHRERNPLLIQHHWSVDTAAHFQLLLPQTAIRFPNFEDLRRPRKITPLAIVFIPPIARRQPVKIDGIDRVHRAAPTRLPIEAHHRDGKADLRGAVKVVAGAH